MSSKPEVLDASALLAWLQNEPGADKVRLKGALINSVNWSEVLQKARQKNVEMAGVREELEALGLAFRGFGLEKEAERAAELYPVNQSLRAFTGRPGVPSDGGALLSGIAVTAESAWTKAECNVWVPGYFNCPK